MFTVLLNRRAKYKDDRGGELNGREGTIVGVAGDADNFALLFAPDGEDATMKVLRPFDLVLLPIDHAPKVA